LLSLGTVRSLRNVSDELVDSVLRADPSTSESLFDGIAGFALGDFELSPEVKADVAVIRGEKDRITSRHGSQRLADRLRGRYVEIPQVGHTPMIEAPDAYAAVVAGAGMQS
jgi:pimeloyl-ACP methyl ester carboxylesterase